MKYLVTVLPKDEVSDPQGEAILDAAHSLGFRGVAGVRAGRSFLVTTEGDDSETTLRELSDRLLSNPIVERFEVTRVDG